MSAVVLSRTRSLSYRGLRLPAGLLGAFVSLIAAIAMTRPAIDPDLNWHLRTGHWILATHQIPTVDPYSFTHLGASWIEHEWLWQALMAGIDSLSGVMGVIAINSIAVAATVALVYARLRTRSVSPQLASVGALACLVGLAAYSQARPAMIALPFAAFFLFAFERYERGRNWRWLAAVIPVGLVWANCHGSYIIGILLCVVYGGGAVWDGRSLRAVGPWAALALTLALVSLANPLGWKLLQFTFGASRLAFNRTYINEWMAPDFRLWSSAALLAMVVLSLLAALVCQRPTNKSQVLLLAGCTLAVLQSQQFVLLYAVGAVPVIAEMIQRGWHKPMAAELSPLTGFALAAVALTLAYAVPIRNLQPRAYQAAVSDVYPADAVAFIRAEHLQGPMWDDFDWGGYLIGALPEMPVFVDGRTELYGNDFLFKYSQTALGQADPDPELDQYGINLALITRDGPLATELRLRPNWREAYHDKLAAVFVRRQA